MKPLAYELSATLEDEHWWYAARRRILVSQVAAILPPRARILDYGCGTGSILAELDHLGEAWGVDRSPAAVEACRARGLRRVVPLAGDTGLGALLEEKPFDLVTAFDVLEHVDDDEAFLRTTREWIAPGGHLALTVPAFDFLWSVEDVVSEHRRRYTRTQVTDLLERAGFVVRNATYFNFLLFPLQCLRAFAGRLRGEIDRPGSLVQPVPRPLNACLEAVFAAEAPLLRRTNLPFGGSILCLGRAPDE